MVTGICILRNPLMIVNYLVNMLCLVNDSGLEKDDVPLPEGESLTVPSSAFRQIATVLGIRSLPPQH
jgi:hypothetical protein